MRLALETDETWILTASDAGLAAVARTSLAPFEVESAEVPEDSDWAPSFEPF
jgi:hypothetical protein